MVALEERIINSRIIGVLNATFLDMVTKSSNPYFHEDFNPILLCNMIYKIGVKLLANRLKGGLLNGISKDKIIFFSMGRSLMQ